jgi:hypothetical protein
MSKSKILSKLQFLLIISRDRSVKRCALATAGELINCFNFKTGKCYPSMETIAGWTGYSRREIVKSLKQLVPKYFLRLSKGNSGGRANTYRPRLELLNQCKGNSPHDLRIGNYEDTGSELEELELANYGSLQTINKTINKTESEIGRLKLLAPLVNKGIHLSTISQVDLELMKKMGLLDKK